MFFNFSFLHLLMALGLLLPFSSALPKPPLAFHKRGTESPSIAIPPSQDPFYTAPPNYELAKPGEVLRIHVAPGNLTSIISNSSAAYKVLYHNVDLKWYRRWNRFALLSVPYDSSDVDASPSYSFYTDVLGTWSDVSIALGSGWHVNVPDYEGPLASYGAGVQSGHATVDVVRAVLSSGFGLTSDVRYALWGYSGGSIASEWAAELQIQYAPELNFAGAALGGLISNVTSTLNAVNGQLYADIIPQGLLGITNQYPEAYKYILEHLNPSGQYNKSAFLSAMNMSSYVGDAFFKDQDIYQYFINGKTDIEAPIVQKVLNVEGQMGYHGVPQMPLFMYKAIPDEIAPIMDTDAIVEKYCSVGANILYERNTIGAHISELYNGDGRAFEWLSSVFDGTYSSKYSAVGCTIRNVTVGTDTSPI